MEIKPQNGVQYLTGLVEKLQKENEVYKTMLESSQATTQAWVDKFNELEKKYDQALTVIASKKIMEMQKENEELKETIKEYIGTFEDNELLRKEIERLEKQLENAVFTDTNYKCNPFTKFKI